MTLRTWHLSPNLKEQSDNDASGCCSLGRYIYTDEPWNVKGTITQKTNESSLGRDETFASLSPNRCHVCQKFTQGSLKLFNDISEGFRQTYSGAAVKKKDLAFSFFINTYINAHMNFI